MVEEQKLNMISCSHWGIFRCDWPFTEIGYRWVDGGFKYYREVQSFENVFG